MTATVIYNDQKDRKLLELVPNKFPIFINFININTNKGKKDGFKIKSHWGAIKNPFIVIEDDENKVIRCFYSEEKSAINQLISFLNESKV